MCSGSESERIIDFNLDEESTDKKVQDLEVERMFEEVKRRNLKNLRGDIVK